MEVTGELARLLEEMAESEGVTRAEIVRRGLSVVKAFRNQRARGRSHLGFTSDPDRLDAMMTGILT